MALRILILVSSLSLAFSAHNFSSYPFSATLNDAPLYELYWNFDNDAETISFAVRVETTGWVGLGLSPNGQMPNSDVVIGWVTDDGQTMFHDRFAAGRIPPTIDEQQDWKLISGEEEGGFTILEFSRNYITCDDNDLPILAETARVIWSLSDSDPTSKVLTSSDVHSAKGFKSLNLLGGLPDAAPDPKDIQSYDVTVENFTIPENDTTYWCTAFHIPQFIREQEIYITKFGPIISEGNEAHVHHMLVYLCKGINDTHVGKGGECEEGVPDVVSACRASTILGVWAVGGEVFIYPDDVGFPFGGPDFPEYVLLEIHYDNPTMIEGTIDSSGMTFLYTSTPRKYNAGNIGIGHSTNQQHIIPPNVKNFITTVILSPKCTSKYFPEDGIHVFGSLLHTHIIGQGLTVQHIRYNSECGVYEELKPIDENLKYDFDYQQTNHLAKEVIIKPGDIIQLKCYYNTEDRDGVTLGGPGTRDEMCFSFLYYYPQVEFQLGFSEIDGRELNEYLNLIRPAESAGNFRDGLNSIDWENEVGSFQNLVSNSTQFAYCLTNQDEIIFEYTNFTDIGCPYIAPDQCSNTAPLSCCERLAATETTEGGTTEGAGIVKISISLLILSLLINLF